MKNLRAKEMSRGRCLRDDVSAPPDAGDLDDADGLPRTPPTAPTPVSRDEADQQQQREKSGNFFLMDGWMDES